MIRTQCTNCGARTGLATNFSDGDYCFACKQKTYSKSLIKTRHPMTSQLSPEKIYQTSEVITASEAALKYLRQYYFTDRDFMATKFSWSPTLQRIIYPINERACWGRSLKSDNKLKMCFYGDPAEDCLYIKNPENDAALVIVEDILSCYRVSDYYSCLALCGTKLKPQHLLTFMSYKNIILWLDGDLAGIKGAEQIKRDFKLYKNIRIITTRKDPKCHSPHEIEEVLQ